jgi:HSP20 family protein
MQAIGYMRLRFLDGRYISDRDEDRGPTMTNIEPLKVGHEVFLRRPIQIYAKVIGRDEGDLGLPEERVRYAVQLLPLEQYYMPEDLEPSQRPQPAELRVDSVTPESVEEPAPLNERAPSLSSGDPFFDLAQEISNVIASRAYELYEARGIAHGHDGDDWLQAESEILLNVPVDIAETETQLTIHAEVPGFCENDLEVRVVPHSVCITGERRQAPEQMESKCGGAERRPNRIFCVVDLPSEIDPVRVDASVGGGLLEVKFAKADLRKVVPVRAKAASA